MIAAASALTIAGLIILLLTLVYCLAMIRRHWDVLIKDRRFLTAQVVIETVLLLFLLFAYYQVYRLWPGIL